MKKTTWIWIVAAVLVLAALVVGMLAIYDANKPKPPADTDTTTQSTQDGTTQSSENVTTLPAGTKSITVEVVHGDGTKKTFEYQSAQTYLSDVVYEAGLVIADENNPGMFHTVDGEKADWNVNQSYWAFYIGEDYAMYGIEQTPIEDGAVYRLVYTIG